MYHGEVRVSLERINPGQGPGRGLCTPFGTRYKTRLEARLYGMLRCTEDLDSSAGKVRTCIHDS